MDPFSEQGLAAPSLQHGCSTVDDSTGWTEVAQKKRKTKVDKELIVLDLSDSSNKESSMDQGSPPFHDKNNRFGILDDDSTPEHEEESQYDTVSYGKNPNKKIKLTKNKKNTGNDADFETACQESLQDYTSTDMKMETYFKFENGMITKLKSRQDRSGHPLGRSQTR